MSETKIKNITFDNIVDYLIILVYLIKKLGIQKKELNRIVKSFEMESENLRKKILIPVHTSIVGSDMRKKIEKLANFV